MSDSARKAIEILDALRFAPEGSSARILAAQTGIPKSTVQRLLQTLEETQMVVQDRRHLSYRLGPRTLMLGMAYKRGLGIGQVALPVLTSLRDRTGETAGLSVRVGEGRMFIEEVQSESELRFASELGRLYPLWSGAPGRILMMDLSAEEANRMLAAAHRTTNGVHSPIDPDTVLARVEEARRTKSARAYNETLDNISSLAVPVRDSAGSTIAALSVSGPSGRLTNERMDVILPELFAASRDISRVLGADSVSASVPL